MMEKDSLSYLEELMSVPCPSGFEQPAQKLVRQRMKKFTPNVKTDVHGNVMGILNEKAPLRVMLAGHVDEIGLMVSHIDDEGYLYVKSIGGYDVAVLPALRVDIHTAKGPLRGIFGKKAIHLMNAEDRKKVAQWENLWIDIGAKNGKEARAQVSIGDPVTISAGFERLRNGNVVSRGFDDRIGSFVVTEALRLLSKKKLRVAVYAVSTVQEELGLRGAKTSAFGIDPQVGIAVDVGFASDWPGANKKSLGEVKLGKGPILHRGANINPVVGGGLEETAKRKKIPTQMSAAPGATGTDANAIQVTRAGAAAALVSIPNRYMHTPVEVINLKDTENCAKLLAEYVASLKPGMDFTP